MKNRFYLLLLRNRLLKNIILEKMYLEIALKKKKK
nr:MAG TPA: hypothetical protein [Caudoviricetes sp.]